PESFIAQVLSPAFALLLARYVVPRFNAAKKWRNKVAGPLILLLCILALIFWLSGWISANTRFPMPGKLQLLHSAIIGLLLLMTFMGGRVIAPAVAGTLEKKGIPLEARVQPRIEGALLLLLLTALLTSLIGPLPVVTGLLLLASAALIFVRTLRWRLWHCPERPDLLVLALGYLWLAAGASALGVYMIAGLSVVPALHLITIGALGTLSASVMLRLAWQRAHRSSPPAWQVLALGLLMAASAIARYLAGPNPFSEQGWLWLSAGLWSLAYSGITVQLFLLVRPAHTRRK
ncbi:MAG TPA: NnrS family protein, partial [Marinobacter sp.]|nr:NnrS family protein [Marinobacter sp.]